MKNIAISTLAVVSFAMLAAGSAQAQTGYGNSYSGSDSQPQFTPYAPSHTSAYGSRCSGSGCPNGRCGTTNGYRGTYGSNTAYGQGSPFGSLFGPNSHSSSHHSNSRYSAPAHRPTTPYRATPLQGTTPYGSTGFSGSPYSGTGVNGGSNPFYGSY